MSAPPITLSLLEFSFSFLRQQASALKINVTSPPGTLLLTPVVSPPVPVVSLTSVHVYIEKMIQNKKYLFSLCHIVAANVTRNVHQERMMTSFPLPQ